MPVITKITTQQKNMDRYNIYMDYGKGEEYAFSVDENVLIKFSLKKGMELDDFSLMEIRNNDDVRKTYNRAIHYISRRMRSEKEVRDYLVKKEMVAPAIDEVIHKLTEQKYLDDEQFAIAFVRTLVNTTDKGINTVRSELKEKGIAEPLIRSSLTEYTKDQQIEKAIKLCEKGIKKYHNESERIQKQKIEQMLSRKGYPFEIISIAIEEANVNGEQDQEMEAIKYQGEKAQRKYAKLSGYEYRQKMKQALFRKGFSIELIDRFLEETDD
jgi:regulatory protein